MTSHPGFASRLFVSGSIAYLLIGILGNCYGVVLPDLARRFGMDEGAASLLLTIHALGSVTAVAACTFGIRGLTTRRAILAVALGAGLVAGAPWWPLALTGGFIGGLGYGVICVIVSRAFVEGFGPRSPGMLGVVNAVAGAGAVVGPLLLVAMGGRAAALYGLIAVAALIILPLFNRGEDGAEGATPGVPDLRGGRIAVVMLNGASTIIESSLAGFGLVAMMAWGWAEDPAAGLVSAFFAAFLISRLSLYWVSRLMAPERLFLLATFGSALFLGLAAAGWTAPGYVAAGFCVGMAFPSYYVWGRRILGPDPRMQSAMLLSGLLGWAIGPLIFRAFLQPMGFAALFGLAAVYALGLGVVILFMLRATDGMASRAGA